MVKTKKGWLAREAAVNWVWPKAPSMTVSAIWMAKVIRFWAAMGKAIKTSFFRKSRSFSIFFMKKFSCFYFLKRKL